jgi:predicted helicase
VRANPKIAGTTHNVFGIQTGVAIMFLVRKEKQERTCRIEYVTLDDFAPKAEKLSWLRDTKFKDIAFDRILPDSKNNWRANMANSRLKTWSKSSLPSESLRFDMTRWTNDR